MKAFFILKKLIPSIVRGGKFQPIELLLKKKHIISWLKYCVYIFLVSDHHNSKIRLKYYLAKLLYNKLLLTFCYVHKF